MKKYVVWSILCLGIILIGSLLGCGQQTSTTTTTTTTTTPAPDDCSSCNTGTTPYYVYVTISGVTDDVCSDCDNVNVTSVKLTQHSVLPCVYTASNAIPGGLCGGQPAWIEVYLDSGGYMKVRIGVAAAAQLVWKKAVTATFDCSSLNESLTYSAADSEGSCDGSSSTCTVTS